MKLHGNNRLLVGKNHKITPDEAKAYLTKEFGASVE